MNDLFPPEISCGTMSVYYRLLAKNITYARNQWNTEKFSLEYIRKGIKSIRTDITVIPIVVHVVHNSDIPEQNVSEAQIHSQIDVLNRDYRKQNADITSIPVTYQHLAADARIEFVLASTDPNGKASNGITRTATTATGFNNDDRVKSAAKDGADSWPSDRYLNLWVCNLNGGLQGYTQFPGGSTATDGVVIAHKCFGTTGTAVAPFNLGRTATHQIGHWLNLRHTWVEVNRGYSRDFINDLLMQTQSEFDKPNFFDGNVTNDRTQTNYMNFMDCNHDVARLMFTIEQVIQMHATLDNLRASLGSTHSENSSAYWQDAYWNQGAPAAI